jgi:hypothetical protein
MQTVIYVHGPQSPLYRGQPRQQSQQRRGVRAAAEGDTQPGRGGRRMDLEQL